MTLTVSVTGDLAACHALRRTVFIEEQQVPEELEMDDKDGGALHFLAVLDGTPVGTARVLLSATEAKIGRVCVLAEHRGTGIGKALMHSAMATLRDDPTVTQAVLSAQISALGFYEALGFVAEGPIYDDAGIPHRTMRCDLNRVRP
ncbi:GNAT family N-acetyltransferase [Palleronia caenipelagi]|uniref:GNAT family N-acetyltransferase n=1 Tax=Palleronia caenipelagi TaxID=2489174 RepID=A0A547Q2K5_9RHOB|nr:GNAT family N-acetyltransferase [Palleronia caenipelagi]TRD20623.1 GNAT family N-acetyltransferase [Palleronia caenipelagi]